MALQSLNNGVIYKVMKKRVRAIIIENESLLSFKRVKAGEVYWVFPGGGVEEGEILEDALTRECEEELGVKVKIEELMFENSFFRENSEEQKEYFYKCVIIDGKIGTGAGPEFQKGSNYEGTHEIEWLKIKDLDSYDLRPMEIKKRLLNLYEK